MKYPEAPSSITKRFYWRPVLIDKNGNGLYNLSDFSHLAPIYVINSKNLITIFLTGDNSVATQDSVEVALAKHGNSVSLPLKKKIVEKMGRL